MGLLEEGMSLLDNRLKPIVLQCIPDCLRTDRIGDDVVDEFGGLNCIVKLSSGDLTNDELCVMGGELERAASFVIFLVVIHLIFDSSNS